MIRGSIHYREKRLLVSSTGVLSGSGAQSDSYGTMGSFSEIKQGKFRNEWGFKISPL
jgi:hypothetical protein